MTTCEHAQILRAQPDCGSLVRSAVALVRQLYPRHTAKRLARDIGCPVDTARGYLSGRSMPVAVVERVAVRHGWPAVLAIFEPLLGPIPISIVEREALKHDIAAFETQRADLVAAAPRGLGWLVPPAVAPLEGRAAGEIAPRRAGGRP